jgi:hypothetical protein
MKMKEKKAPESYRILVSQYSCPEQPNLNNFAHG